MRKQTDRGDDDRESEIVGVGESGSGKEDDDAGGVRGVVGVADVADVGGVDERAHVAYDPGCADEGVGESRGGAGVAALSCGDDCGGLGACVGECDVAYYVQDEGEIGEEEGSVARACEEEEGVVVGGDDVGVDVDVVRPSGSAGEKGVRQCACALKGDRLQSNKKKILVTN